MIYMPECGGRKMRMLELKPNKKQDDDQQSLEICLNKMLLYFSLAGLAIQTLRQTPSKMFREKNFADD